MIANYYSSLLSIYSHSNPIVTGKQIKNRLFTVQVICGDIQYYMNISVDQLMPGGANLAIEIQKIAMEQLSQDLAALGLAFPPIVNWQFDNCGENKVIKYYILFNLFFNIIFQAFYLKYLIWDVYSYF